MQQKKRLGELLVSAGLIDEYQLRSALSHQQQWGGRLGKNLVELGLVTETRLVAFLAKHFRLPTIDFRRIRITPNTLKLLSPELVKKHHVMPLFQGEEEGKKFLAVAMSNPTDLLAIDELEFASGNKVRPVVASDLAIANVIAYYYNKEGAEPFDHSAKSSGDIKYADLIAMTRLVLKDAKEGPAQPDPGTRVPKKTPPPAERPGERTIDMEGAPPAGDDDSIVVFGAAGEKTLSLDGKPKAPAPAPAASAQPQPTPAAPSDGPPNTDQVLRAVVNILIDKGILTREEIRDRLKAGG